MIYRHHPQFSGAAAPRRIVGRDGAGAATVEGGDVMMLSPSVVAVGMSERTCAVGVERLDADLLDVGSVALEVALALPHWSSFVHHVIRIYCVHNESPYIEA